MKALTVWQPWASLIAWGEKTIETRSWFTPYRGPLAIHAGARWTREQQTCCWQPGFAQALIRHGINAPDELPRGAIVCIVQLVATFRTDTLRERLDIPELRFGDYTPGRFAWKLDVIEVLKEPIPASGKQGLWEWTR